MQRVKDRKLYDTETAEQIARHAPNTDQDDFHYLVETLYRTADGEYFIHGEGGAATKYARRVSNGKTSGEEITRLTREEALNWCEDRAIDGKTVAEEFGDLLENVDKTS